MSADSVTLVATEDDNIEFVVPMHIARKSLTVAQLIDDLGADVGVPLPCIMAAVLAKVIEFITAHASDWKEPDATVSVDVDQEPPKEADPATTAPLAAHKPHIYTLTDWDRAFFGAMSHEMLFALLAAFDNLSARYGMDATGAYIASLIKDKTGEQIRALFNLPAAFTPEEEAQLRSEIEAIE